MKRMAGAVLMIAGAIFLYLFVARAMYAARGMMGVGFDANLPLQALGHEYPTDVLLFLGAIWGFLLGLGLVLMPEEASKGGRVARVMLLNALFLLSSLFVAYIGGKTKADAGLVAVFGVVALAQSALGFFLLIFALFERPKGIASLLLGVPLYLGGVGIGLYTLLVLGGGP
ncbi:MAG TPA: hypothetical protein VJB14_14025 [Planctomycetota bacterium]|nr:hypothetical protein [Planctomycetota bacterium]